MPFEYTINRGFMGQEVTARGAVWVWDDTLTVFPYALLIVLFLYAVAISFLCLLRGLNGASYPWKRAVCTSAIIIAPSLVALPNDEGQLAVWTGTSSPVSFGVGASLLALFVLFPSAVFLIDSSMVSRRGTRKVLWVVTAVTCLFAPFSLEEFHGLLGHSERVVNCGVVCIASGRWGLTDSSVFRVIEPATPPDLSYTVSDFSSLLVVLMRLMFLMVLTWHLSGRTTSTWRLLAAAAALEVATTLTVLDAVSRASPPPVQSWSLLPLPSVLPIALAVAWIARRIECRERAKSSGTDRQTEMLAGDDMITVPLSVRVMSTLLLIERRLCKKIQRLASGRSVRNSE
ncbi:MAG: hypothetical protein HXY34_05745 [Candidatus Thorarchaeota archaeon]|nr:hypothetical protein [Candidatus Thorarchaeota archaeon]